MGKGMKGLAPLAQEGPGRDHLSASLWYSGAIALTPVRCPICWKGSIGEIHSRLASDQRWVKHNGSTSSTVARTAERAPVDFPDMVGFWCLGAKGQPPVIHRQ